MNEDILNEESNTLTENLIRIRDAVNDMRRTTELTLENPIEDIADAVDVIKTENQELIEEIEELEGQVATTEDYMRISDLLEYPATPNEDWYVQSEIDKVDALIEHFENLGPGPTPPTPADYVENTQDRCIETGVVMEEGSTYKIEIQFASTNPNAGGDERHVFSAYDEGDYLRLCIAYWDEPKYWECANGDCKTPR